MPGMICTFCCHPLCTRHNLLILFRLGLFVVVLFFVVFVVVLGGEGAGGGGGGSFLIRRRTFPHFSMLHIP